MTAALVVVFLFGQSPQEAHSLPCGERNIHTSRPTKARNPVPGGLPPIVIGESTLTLPTVYLPKKGYAANARSCRRMTEGIEKMHYLRKNGKLPHFVILYFGINDHVTAPKIRRALRIAGPRRVLGLVTGIDFDAGRQHGSAAIFAAGRAHPHHLLVLDWFKYSRGHGGWFVPDHHHPTIKGARNFARYLAKAIRFAKPRHFPHGKRSWL